MWLWRWLSLYPPACYMVFICLASYLFPLGFVLFGLGFFLVFFGLINSFKIPFYLLCLLISYTSLSCLFFFQWLLYCIKYRFLTYQSTFRQYHIISHIIKTLVINQAFVQILPSILPVHPHNTFYNFSVKQ